VAFRELAVRCSLVLDTLDVELLMIRQQLVGPLQFLDRRAEVSPTRTTRTSPTPNTVKCK
jgi:hypothetical protein